ncbi:hypothetical protein P170DRAFT_506141 [Aspergillus steynii IBT 23096]|uniref:Uncharacterized protein n=1 Tax=Aspergillus steynii IBT 23096 TaxID=1392250 RepID=A0A2I2GRT1_9EURO|nr:uncharacterized protein P170DRAFT_506141 [Aspergillus steynii IBT 23096]PLB55573.1 hypothetical protein P170DRAFT_506141 [Aspergillus steynii IBT 23096]
MSTSSDSEHDSCDELDQRDPDELWQEAMEIDEKYRTRSIAFKELEASLHKLWRGVKKIDASPKEREEAILPNGQRLWTDLPYFVDDIHNFWENVMFDKSVPETKHLNRWLATMSCAGIYTVELLQCSLRLFSGALEEKKVLELMEDSFIKPDGHEYPDVLSVEQMLPLCAIWMKYTGSKLAILSANPPGLDENACISHPPGPFAREAGITDSGLSIGRWQFWRKEFQKFSQKKKWETFSSPAKDCVLWWDRASRRAGILLDEAEESMGSDGTDTEQLRRNMEDMSIGTNFRESAGSSPDIDMGVTEE